MANSISSSLVQIRRTPYQALAAVMVLSLTFFAATMFSFIFFGASKVLKYFEAAPQAIAFFEKGVDLSDSEISQIKNKLEDTGKLGTFKYVSTRDAEKLYKEKNKDDPLLLELVDYKILPPSIEISAIEIQSLSGLKEILKQQPKVTDVIFYEDIVNTLGTWVNNLRFVGLALIFYLSIQSILILMLIVSLKIMGKREEIEILRLLGASFWFIVRPFLIEGVVYGFLGAFFGFILASSLLFYTTPLLLTWLGDIPVFPIPYTFLAEIFIGEIFAGFLLGICASLMGVRRFIHD